MDFSPRQIEIIQAATKLIGEKGIQNMTTKHLAEEIGFSEPALYRHFKGKTEILVSVLEYFRAQMRKGLAPLLVKQKTGLDKIKQIIEFQFNLFTQNPAIIMVIFAETSFQYDQMLSSTVNRLLIQKKQMVIKIIEEGKQDGSIRKDINVDQLMSIILGSMRFTVLQWRMSKFQFNLTEKGKELYKAINLLIKN
ncbi:Transcriptional regulator, AcrR family [hydrothermal vent metagenome]|uniref:Transcriptional regulator, AcrR family n=1 Tax=hydrothermal vent metagenome TaxID=652676 RepID=A0A3B0UDM0_9ZZZZ